MDNNQNDHLKAYGLIYWTLQNSLNSKKIHSTWVSSDNKKILDYSSISEIYSIFKFF